MPIANAFILGVSTPKQEETRKMTFRKYMLWQQSKYRNSSAVHQSEVELNCVDRTYANQQYTCLDQMWNGAGEMTRRLRHLLLLQRTWVREDLG